MKKRIFTAILLSIGISATSYGHVTAPIKPLEADLFHKVVVEDRKVLIIPDFGQKYDKKPHLAHITAENKPKTQILAQNKPKSVKKSSKNVSGTATWYCLRGVSSCHYRYPDTSGLQMYAAAGSEIRIGHWRGRTVRVCSASKCIHVKLVDWCACGGSRIIDLYSDAFRQLLPLGRGTVKVKVSW